MLSRWMAANQTSVRLVLFMDTDITVINPHRRIEEFVNASVDLTFYDRFFNFEYMAGSFIAR